MGQKRRKPRAEHAPSEGRQVRIGQDPGSAQFHWRTNKMDFGGPWGWHLVHPCYVHRKIIPDLQSFEGMTWTQIKTGASKGSGSSIHGSKLHDKARARLRQLGIDEDQHFFELKFDHKTLRLWGVRGAALRILWWDPHHEVYPAQAGQQARRRQNTPIKTRPLPALADCPLSESERQADDMCRQCIVHTTASQQ